MVMVGNAECPFHAGPSSVVLMYLFILKFLVRNTVVEKHVTCYDHGNPKGVPSVTLITCCYTGSYLFEMF